MSDLDREFGEGEVVWLQHQGDTPVDDGWGAESGLDTDRGTESVRPGGAGQVRDAPLDMASADASVELGEGEVEMPRHPAELRADDGWGVDSDLDGDRSVGSVRPGGVDQASDAWSDVVSEDLVAGRSDGDAMQHSEALGADATSVVDSAPVDDRFQEQLRKDRRYGSFESDSHAPAALEEEQIDLLCEDRRDLPPDSKDGLHADGGDASPLTTEHRDALRQYTGIGHHELNTTLRGSSVDRIQDLASRSAVLTEALEQMPVHEGTVFRGSSTVLDDAAIARYEPGARVVENQYLSTTVDPDVEFGGNVLWIVDSKQGRSIESESSLEQEHEVLFDRFAVFDVLAKDYDDELDRWVIYMAER